MRCTGGKIGKETKNLSRKEFLNLVGEPKISKYREISCQGLGSVTLIRDSTRGRRTGNRSSRYPRGSNGGGGIQPFSPSNPFTIHFPSTLPMGLKSTDGNECGKIGEEERHGHSFEIEDQVNLCNEKKSDDSLLSTIVNIGDATLPTEMGLNDDASVEGETREPNSSLQSNTISTTPPPPPQAADLFQNSLSEEDSYDNQTLAHLASKSHSGGLVNGPSQLPSSPRITSPIIYLPIKKRIAPQGKKKKPLKRKQTSKDDNSTPPVLHEPCSASSSKTRKVVEQPANHLSKQSATQSKGKKKKKMTSKGKKKIKMTSKEKMHHFLGITVLREKIADVKLLEECGASDFLNKLKAQGWYTWYTSPDKNCCNHEVSEFYANCKVVKGIVQSSVGGVDFSFDVILLGKLIGVPVEGYDFYVKKAWPKLDNETTPLAICRKFAQSSTLSKARAVLKCEMSTLHKLLFWFVIKSVIPRRQGRDEADFMTLVLMDLLDSEKQINLPAIMMSHIDNVANTKNHCLAYGFAITKILEHFNVSLSRKLRCSNSDEVGCTTLDACGYVVQSLPTPPMEPYPQSANPRPNRALLQENAFLKEQVTIFQQKLQEEAALGAQRHAEMLTLLSHIAKPNLP